MAIKETEDNVCNKGIVGELVSVNQRKRIEELISLRQEILCNIGVSKIADLLSEYLQKCISYRITKSQILYEIMLKNT